MPPITINCPLAMELKLITSDDGSHTLFVPELNENYHSTYGAATESMHVYIANGLNAIGKTNITILEVGFGTGLNALLTLLNKGQKTIHYIAVEKFPLPMETWKELNHGKQFGPEAAALFSALHLANWNEQVSVAQNFTIHKINGDFRKITIPQNHDLVYFDAFGPEKQPDLWQLPVFEKVFNTMNNHGILVTYCAKGQVRRTLQQVGFTTERLPGPPRKREMLRATKQKNVVL
jgi:tRNA U34 5-methylaminomethyl-2-thiouridine-forming methyltransferase MnmC